VVKTAVVDAVVKAVADVKVGRAEAKAAAEDVKVDRAVLRRFTGLMFQRTPMTS
jgi:hypothetical protein